MTKQILTALLEQKEKELEIQEELNKLLQEKIDSQKIIIEELLGQQELADNQNKLQDLMLKRMKELKAGDENCDITMH
jgi:hypothetical protein